MSTRWCGCGTGFRACGAGRDPTAGRVGARQHRGSVRSGGHVHFSKRLSRVAALATWGGIVLAIVGAVVLHHEHNAVRVHLASFLASQGLAVVDGVALTVLPTLHDLTAHAGDRISSPLAVLLVSTLLAVT